MKATVDTWKDVQKYFLDTFVICPEYSEREALYIDRVEVGGMRVQCVDGNKGYVEFPYEIKSPLNSRREYWQHKDEAYLIARHPARMWRKGICNENTLMSKVTSDGLLSGSQFSGPLIKSFVERKGTFPASLNETEGTFSVALSEMWAWAKASGTLSLLGYPVGKLNPNKKLIMLLKEFNKFPLPPQLKEMKVVNV